MPPQESMCGTGNPKRSREWEGPMAVLGQQKWLHSGTEVRKGRSMCKESRFWLEIRRVSREQDYRKFENSTWNSHQRDDRVLHLIKTLTCFGRNAPSSKFHIFIERLAEKTDKINKSWSGKKSYVGRKMAGTACLASPVSVSGHLPVSARVPCSGPCTKDAAEPPAKAGVPGCTKKAQHSSTCWSLLLPEAMIRSKRA